LFVALGAVASFGMLSILEASRQGPRIFLGTTAAVSIAFLLVLSLNCLDAILSRAFSVPFALYLLHLGTSMYTGNFWDFFPVCIGICGLGALYFESRKLIYYILLSNVISLILLVNHFPMTKFEAGIQVTIPYDDTMFSWFLSLICSAFIFIITFLASGRSTAAVRAQNSFLSLLSSTHNRIVMLDSLNQVMYYSKPFADMVKLANPKMAIGRPLLDIVKSIDLKMLLYDMLTKDSDYEITTSLVIDGVQYYFDVLSYPFAGEFRGRLINLIDISPVMKAKLEAETASRSKSQFLATMSHEIRTPLNAIIGLSEIELQKKLPVETRQDLERILNSGASLLAIINDILDISKIEAGSFDLVQADYDVPSLLNDTVHLNIVRIGSKRIVFKLEIDATLPVRLLGDELRVKQILNNLLSNAFKYTEEGAVIFKVEWERQGNTAQVQFTISDTGRGMREEDIPKLFSEYSQLDATANRHIEGTGLGLSITKNLVMLMNGDISVKSKYGKGSTFTVRLPQLIVNESPIGESTARNLEQFRFKNVQPGRGIRLMRSYMPYGRVLVVDDVETNLDVAKGLMLPYGLAIDFATSGSEAIEKIRKAGINTEFIRYDLVLMDHMMPGMDGVEAVRIIRDEIDSDYARTVPIVALTANALAGNEEMFLANGFNAYISKPIDIMQLDVALNTWVKNKQSKETLLEAEREQLILVEENIIEGPGILDDFFVEGVNLIRGRERYNGEAAYLEILRSYSLHTPALLKKLRYLSPDALPEYTVTVHGLKGSSYGICADTIGKKAEELEHAARAGAYKEVLAENGAFIKMVEMLLADLGEVLKKAALGKGEKQKVSTLDAAKLSRLLDAVKRYKSILMEEIMAEIESYEYESGQELVQWLREQMDNLEYDAIRERLEAFNPLDYKKEA
jgi:signal transduction histidine kinase/AmiR/NasT family two-component response regulator